MAADGRISSSGSGSNGGPTGSELLTDADEEIVSLNDRSTTSLTSVGGTANAITASFTPTAASIATGRRFSFIAAANNTGAVTLALNGGSAVAVVADDGDPLAADQIVSGRLYSVMFDGTSYRLENTGTVAFSPNYQAFTANGTWTKPANTPDNALVLIEIWGGGGGGGTRGSTSSPGGGGGGGYLRLMVRAASLSATETVTVGAGGAAGSSGSASSFGSHGTAWGGAAGQNTTGLEPGGGGAGGSPIGLGEAGGATTTGVGGIAAGRDGGDGGDAGSASAGSPGSTGIADGGAGGGGGGPSGYAGGDGGAAVNGGGGGGGYGPASGGSGGNSTHGGAGGDSGADGAVPGGGGGATAAGARGEVRIMVIG